MEIKKIYIGIIAAALLCSVIAFAGCKQDNSVISGTDEIENNDINDEAQNDIDNMENKDDNSSDEDITPPEEIKFRNPLTGMPCEETTVTSRPVAIMINNLKQAIPQHGIADADIIYECIVEGGITRLMALCSDYENLPLTGSVRSSRDYYLDLVQSHDAIYAHCGGSEDAYTAISSRRIDNIDGVRGSYAASSAYWKDSDRVKNMGYEHASMTNGEKLSKAIKDLKFRTELSENFEHPLTFGTKDSDFDGESVVTTEITYSYYAKSYFVYDEELKEYKKGQYNEPHIDANTDAPLSFKNVIILGASYTNTNDSYNHMNLSFTGTGKGYYISNGKLKNIVWKKTDRQSPYSLYEEDGETKLLLNPGKSYIGITNGLSCVSLSETADYNF